MLDELGARIVRLPEPLAALATSVEIARAEGDATGVRMRLFDIGIGVVRYAVSIGLACVAAVAERACAPRPLAEALWKAARLSDGQWCALARVIAAAPGPSSFAGSWSFLSGRALSDLVAARNRFIHGGGHGGEAPELVRALLDEAAPLLEVELLVVAAIDSGTVERRVGTPLRAGLWRKAKVDLPDGAAVAEAYVLFLEGPHAPSWLRVTPWLPMADNRIHLIDAPHALGKSWRSLDPDTGEHRDHARLHAAIRHLAGADPDAPQLPSDRPALIGREATLDCLRRAASEAQAGGVRVVVLTGPLGIGRSRCLQELREAAHGIGFSQVMAAACSSQRRSPLRPLRAAAGEVGLAEVTAAVDAALAGDALASPESLQAALEAVESALVEVSSKEPLLVVLDDVQWADDQTLAVLRLLTERATLGSAGRICVAIAVRDEPTWGTSLRRLLGEVEQDVGSGATRIELEPLREAAARVVRGVAPVAPELEQHVCRGAAGVPFFLVQPLLVWHETGALEWIDRRWCPTRPEIMCEPVPGVSDLVRARLTSFFEPGSEAARAAEQVLALVAVAGERLSSADVIDAATRLGTRGDAVENAMEGLVDASLIALRGTQHETSFRQPMVRLAVLELVRDKPWFPRARRALLDVLASRSDALDDAAFLAHEFEDIGAVTEATLWLERAATRALSIGAFLEAARHAERLAVVASTPERCADAVLLRVDALHRAGMNGEALELLCELMLLVASDRTRIRARILRLTVSFALGKHSLDAGATLVEDADKLGDERLTIEARLARATTTRGRAALALVDDALARLACAGRGAAVDLLHRACALRFELLYEIAAPTDACRAALEHARQAARAAGSRWAELDAESDLAVMEAERGNHEEAVVRFGRLAQEAERAGFSTLRATALVNIAATELRAGRLQAAAEAAAVAATVARAAASWRHLASAQSVQASALLGLGELEGARAAIESSVELKIRGGDSRMALALMRRATIRERMNDMHGAREDAMHALEEARRAGNDADTIWARLWLAVDARGRGEPRAAEELRELVNEAGSMLQRLSPEAREKLVAAKALDA